MKKNINILADENIPALDELLHCLDTCEIKLRQMRGRDINASDLEYVDVLLTRSVTKVTKDLLQLASSLEFVGTATSGLDHIDQGFLKQQGIAFYAAQGANANAVAEFVLASLVSLKQKFGRDVFREKIAIVGFGHVGKALKQKLEFFGCELVVYDPPLKAMIQETQSAQENCFSEWEEVLQCSVISFHVPWTRDGGYPTEDMMNADFFKALQKGSLIINAARGEICNEAALLSAKRDKAFTCLWDVWKSEPSISPEMLEAAEFATPHIAGYSADAKLQASFILVEALAKFYAVAFDAEKAKQIMSGFLGKQRLNCEKLSSEDIILQCYNPEKDTRKLKSLLQENNQNSRAKAFDDLRKTYPKRMEWKNFELQNLDCSQQEQSLLKNLGFTLL